MKRIRGKHGTNASLAFTNLQVGFAFTNRILLNPAGTIVNQSSNKVSLSLSRTTGLFSGSVTPPASPGGKAWTFSGALLQKPVLGGGFLLGTNQSGPVTLGP